MKNPFLLIILLILLGSCRKEMICAGEICTISSASGCGGLIVTLSSGDRILDNSLRLWDVKANNRTKYCVMWENLSLHSSVECTVDYTAEIISISKL